MNTHRRDNIYEKKIKMIIYFFKYKKIIKGLKKYNLYIIIWIKKSKILISHLLI
jgi:hypothetical protein